MNPALAAPLVIHPMIGFLVTGKGDYKYDDSYSGSTTQTPAPTSSSSDEKSGFVLGADVLARVAPGIRAGGTILWVPSVQASTGGRDVSAGHQVMIGGVVEPVFAASPTVALALRGQLGVGLLFPGGDLGNQIDAKKASCSQDLAQGDPKCDVTAFGFGWNLGAGGGVIASLGSGGLRLRSDLVVQYMSQGLWSYSHTHAASAGAPEYTHDVSYSVSGVRVWLLAGLEI
jgi:hypothetical protein